MPLSIEKYRQDRCVVLSLAGSLMGAASAKKLRSAISDTIAENQRLILVKLSGLGQGQDSPQPPMDDFGVESLLAGAFMASYADGALRLFGANELTEFLNQNGAAHLIIRAETEADAAEELYELVPDAQPFDILQFVREEERQDTVETEIPEPQG